MDLHYTAEETAFRHMVRAFLDTHLPADLQRKVRQHLRLNRDDQPPRNQQKIQQQQ